eukprot:820609_1
MCHKWVLMTRASKYLLFLGDVYDTILEIETFKQRIQLTNFYKSLYDDYRLYHSKNTGIAHFRHILNIKDKDERRLALLNPVHWYILIDAICLNMTDADNKPKRLWKLRKIAQKACHDENRRSINLNLEGAVKSIVNVHGALELLQGVGFERDEESNQYIIFKVESQTEQTIDVMANALMHKMEVLGHMELLQNTWRELGPILRKHPAFEDQNEIITRLVCMDLYNNYEEYCEILRNVTRKTN